MKLYTIIHETREQIALECTDGRLYSILDLGFSFRDMNQLIEEVTETERLTLQEFSLSTPPAYVQAFAKNEVRICSPITTPQQDIICLGVNYKEHIEETVDTADFRGKQDAVYFSKRASRISGDGDSIPFYHFVDSLDYEVELAVILGKTVRDVFPEEVSDLIFGYSVFNDVSARNLQFRHQQWYRGKSLDGYSIMGPCIVTTDDISDAQNLDISCSVNGEVRQHSNTSLMIHDAAAAISELSQGMTLRAGTIIATGTPAGVGLGMKPPCYLQPGDSVRCEIESIGAITNTVRLPCSPPDKGFRLLI